MVLYRYRSSRDVALLGCPVNRENLEAEYASAQANADLAAREAEKYAAGTERGEIWNHHYQLMASLWGFHAKEFKERLEEQ